MHFVVYLESDTLMVWPWLHAIWIHNGRQGFWAKSCFEFAEIYSQLRFFFFFFQLLFWSWFLLIYLKKWSSVISTSRSGPWITKVCRFSAQSSVQNKWLGHKSRKKDAWIFHWSEYNQTRLTLFNLRKIKKQKKVQLKLLKLLHNLCNRLELNSYVITRL